MKLLAARTAAGRGFLLNLAAAMVILFLGNTFSRALTLAEGLDTTNLVWTTGGDAVWFAQTTNTYDGIDAVRSGSLTSNQTSWIETTVVGPGTLNYFMGVVPGDSLPGLSIIYNGDDSEQYALPIQPLPYWMSPVTDLGVGPQTIRWRVASSYDATNTGCVVLDEFQVLPPRPLAFNYVSSTTEVYCGANAGFSAYAIGTPPIYYQWRKEGFDIPNATNAHFNISGTTTNDSGLYSIVVSNSQGVVVSNATLTVLPPTPPFLTYEPQDTTGYVGQTIQLSAAVNGSPPFYFHWRKDGTNLTEDAVVTQYGFSSGSIWLTLTNITAADVGSYSLFVTNDYGSVESTNAVLTVLPSIAPVITRHPRSLEVAAGVNTWLSAAASGDPTPFYSWYRRGDPPPQPPTGPPPPRSGGLPRTNRSFNSVSFTNAGVYSVTATNYAGSITSREALLTVLPPITNLSSWWQGAQDIFVDHGLAFLAQNNFGLGILSVSNPAAPMLLGGYNTPGSAAAVVVEGGRAYVADGSAGLQILSIAYPFNPVRLGGYDTPYSVSDVAVRSNLVYLADGKTGLLIVNASNPAAPVLVGSFHTNFSANSVRVAGNYAYVSSLYSETLPGTNVAGFFVINVADPAHPFEVGRLQFGVGKFEVRNQTVFAVTGNSLQVISITNPAQPVVIGSFSSYVATTNWPPWPTYILASDVCVQNDLVFVGGCISSGSSTESRLYVLDMRDPTEPIPVGYYTNAGQCYALGVDANLVYFTGMDSSLDIIQTPFNVAPTLPPTLKLSSSPALQLELHGRRGRNYDVETSPAPNIVPWQVAQTLLLTNDTIALPIAPTAAAQFYRLKQLD